MFGVAGTLLVALAAVSLLLFSKIGAVPPYDAALDRQLEQKRARKAEAESLYTRGDHVAALAKYREILATTPGARWASRRVREIERTQKADARQQQLLDIAQRKFGVAKSAFDQGQYELARALCEEEFPLDPKNPNTPGLYVRLTEERLMIQQIARVKGAVPAVGKAGVFFRFNSPTNDGYVVVLVDRKQILRENLWEAGTGMAQRKVPRNVIVYRNVAPATSEMIVEIVIPGWKFRESRTIAVTTLEGAVYRIGVTLDRNTRKLDVNLSE